MARPTAVWRTEDSRELKTRDSSPFAATTRGQASAREGDEKDCLIHSQWTAAPCQDLYKPAAVVFVGNLEPESYDF
jgi:hypothetical protein